MRDRLSENARTGSADRTCTCGFKGRRPASWAIPAKSEREPADWQAPSRASVDPGGIEPPATRLRGGCSAVELRVRGRLFPAVPCWCRAISCLRTLLFQGDGGLRVARRVDDGSVPATIGLRMAEMTKAAWVSRGGLRRASERCANSTPQRQAPRLVNSGFVGPKSEGMP